jgi:molybdopterin-dependent oxidoreductase alpha subunit
LPVRISGDMAVLKGLLKLLLARERNEPGKVFDREFIDHKTDGYRELLATLDQTSWEEILLASGLTREQLDEAAAIIAQARSFITCWAMGITQHTEAVATIQDIVNLHLLMGQVGKPGAGLCPVRGHSNVQGDRTMGIWPNMHPVFRANLEREFGFKTPPNDGYNTVEAIQAMLDGKLKVFFAMGGNFASATPDTAIVSNALGNCRLTAQVITKLNRTALTPGKTSLILPCLGRSEIDVQAGGEQFVSTESTMLNVQMSKGVFPPASEHLRSETWIVASLAKAVLCGSSSVDWEKMSADYDNIRDAISRVVPGCENYNERIRKPGGFYMPSPQHAGEFSTPSGRALFRSHPLEVLRLDEGQMMMTTIRSHDQFNTTIYGLQDRYRGIDGDRRVIFMNQNDMADRGLEPGRKVDVTSHFDNVERTVSGFTVVPYAIPKDCAAMYFPEANPLVPLGSVARRSFTPTSKCIIITIRATE